ncbi:MAG: hypothetical protein ACRD1Y_10180 [Terriglobales bacterium]
MRHNEARTIRERLHAISLAIATLEQTAAGPRHKEIAAMARHALEEIAALVSKDEKEEHSRGRMCLLENSAEAVQHQSESD